MSAERRRAIVVGAGAAGLHAARQLMAYGRDVVVFDKGRGVGGRMATRRASQATFDHGAQFFTVRNDRFAELLRCDIDSGLVNAWCDGFDQRDGHPRYRVHGGMTALAKRWATGLDVRLSQLVFRTIFANGEWQVVLDDGTVHIADELVLTCPIPQSFSLLIDSGVRVPEELWRTDYDRTLCLLAVLDRPARLGPHGATQSAPGFTFLADNSLKGISTAPAITAHADATWSGAHWDEPNDTISEALGTLVEPLLGGSRIVSAQIKRWRFATPQRCWPERCWRSPEAPLVLAGDAFDGPRVEGAVLSGLAAAAALDDR
jgi:hypothetical protein